MTRPLVFASGRDQSLGAASIPEDLVRIVEAYENEAVGSLAVCRTDRARHELRDFMDRIQSAIAKLEARGVDAGTTAAWSAEEVARLLLVGRLPCLVAAFIRGFASCGRDIKPALADVLDQAIFSDSDSNLTPCALLPYLGDLFDISLLGRVAFDAHIPDGLFVPRLDALGGAWLHSRESGVEVFARGVGDHVAVIRSACRIAIATPCAKWDDIVTYAFSCQLDLDHTC